MHRMGSRSTFFSSKTNSAAAPRRREEALAFITNRLVRTGSSPTYEEIGLELGVRKSRAQQLVNQLIADGVLEKTPGAQRSLRVRDVVRAREILDEFALSLGWIVASPLGALKETPSPRPLPHVQLPMLPAFEHLPDVD